MTARRNRAKLHLTRLFLKILFSPQPEFYSSPQNDKAYEDIYVEMAGDENRKEVMLPDSIPEADFLNFLDSKQEFLFHGANQLDLDILSPRKQTNFRGEEINGVFASSDPIWAMFFAIINRKKYSGTLRNGSYAVCIPGGVSERYYFFSINKAIPDKDLWSSGGVYILPRDKFQPAGEGLLPFDEWISEEPVIPIAKATIEVKDFPMMGKVAAHREQESIYLSWITYKWRLRNK